MVHPSRLEREQAELLLTLGEAYRFHREPFLVVEAMNDLGKCS